MQFNHHKPAAGSGQVFSCSCHLNGADWLHVSAFNNRAPKVTLMLIGDVAEQTLSFTPDLARAVALRLMAAADALEG